MANTAMPAVYICLQLSNAPRVTESPENTAIHLTWMDSEDLVVTLSQVHKYYMEKSASNKEQGRSVAVLEFCILGWKYT